MGKARTGHKNSQKCSILLIKAQQRDKKKNWPVR